MRKNIAGRLRHPGRFTILIPRELDPVAAGALMPVPPVKPPPEPPAKPAATVAAPTGKAGIATAPKTDARPAVPTLSKPSRKR